MATSALISPFLTDLTSRSATLSSLRRSVSHRCLFTTVLIRRSCTKDCPEAFFRRVRKRSYFTDMFEPSEKINGPPAKELPCTLVLAEDFETVEFGYVSAPKKKTNYAMRQQHSWHDPFSKAFPNLYGIPYTKWALSLEQASFDVALSTLKKDISSSGFQQPVLVTRGPVMSWLAQFYLESLPLSGLVMVDPLPFDKKAAIDLYKSYYMKLCKKDEEPTPEQKQLFSIVDDYINHWDHYTLQLETNVIPMMIVSTMLAKSMRCGEESEEHFYAARLRENDEDDELHTSTFPTGATSQAELDELNSWRHFAERIATRHGEKFREVPLYELDPLDVDHCGAVVHDWINDKVL
jgi:hypothetical protein